MDRADEPGAIGPFHVQGGGPDNSACEGFFGRMKNEMFYHRSWQGVSIQAFILEINRL